MLNQTAPALSSFLAPKYWPTWLGIACFYIIARMPLSWRLNIGACLGRLLFYFAKERRYITQVNIRLCFPELSSAQQQALVYQSFIENGIGVIETTTGWVRKPQAFSHLLEIIGLEDFHQALQQGRGVLLLGAHYTTLDFSANLFSMTQPIGVTYRAQKNPLFDAFMLRGRLQNCNGVFDRHDLRGAFRHLKQGKVLWYAPDQDYGPDHAVFAPFFGNTAATITAASRFAKINHSPAFVVRHHRRKAKIPYEVEFIRLPESYPSGDDIQDASLINQYLEAAIREYPAQYLWLHKRFKTQLRGKIDSPYIELKTPVRKVSLEQFKMLDSPLAIRTFPHGKGGYPWRKSSIKKFDLNAKALKTAGLTSLTVDTIYKISDGNFSAASYHSLEGQTLEALSNEDFPVAALAHFLASFHAQGFMFSSFDATQMLFDGERFDLLNPECIRRYPMSLAYASRIEDLANLFENTKLEGSSQDLLIKVYTEASGLENKAAFTGLLKHLKVN